jgi:hypothetical protein
MKNDAQSQPVDASVPSSSGGRLVMARAIEIATADGRLAINLSKTDWEQAKRELRREED